MGTDGYGRSDTREALRRFFDVDAQHISAAVLVELARTGAMDQQAVAEAVAQLDLEPRGAVRHRPLRRQYERRGVQPPSGGCRYHRADMTGTTYAPAEPADAALVEAARRGDLHAWERLVRRYQEPVYRVAWLIVRDSELAEAATLSTFVRAFRALPSYEPRDLGLLPWLIRIAAGESRQQRRESGRPTRSSRPVEKMQRPASPGHRRARPGRGRRT